MNRAIQIFLLSCAWISAILGIIGVVIPVLPTTPFILLATFLFAKSSPRCHRWIISTKVYKVYVVPFKESGGIPLFTKIRILLISFAVMGVSAYFVQKPMVWIILGGVCIFLLYLMLIRIPTVSKKAVQELRATQHTPKTLR